MSGEPLRGGNRRTCGRPSIAGQVRACGLWSAGPSPLRQFRVSRSAVARAAGAGAGSGRSGTSAGPVRAGEGPAQPVRAPVRTSLLAFASRFPYASHMGRLLTHNSHGRDCRWVVGVCCLLLGIVAVASSPAAVVATALSLRSVAALIVAIRGGDAYE